MTESTHVTSSPYTAMSQKQKSFPINFEKEKCLFYKKKKKKKKDLVLHEQLTVTKTPIQYNLCSLTLSGIPFHKNHLWTGKLKNIIVHCWFWVCFRSRLQPYLLVHSNKRTIRFQNSSIAKLRISNKLKLLF